MILSGLRGDAHLPPQFCVTLPQRHLMATFSKQSCRFHASRPTADHKHLLVRCGLGWQWFMFVSGPWID
ncbi:hypothetical protein D3C78_1627210 [compost metagenome]